MASNVDVGSFLGSSFNGDKAIEKIMTGEKKKEIPVKNQKFTLNMQKKAWQGISQKLSDLNSATRAIYSPIDSPFKKINTESSDEDLLKAERDPKDPENFKPGSYKVIPKQMAQPDHFRSDTLGTSKKIPATSFSILYKKKSYPINFSGGSLKDLKKTLDASTKDFLQITTPQISDQLYVLDIQGKKPGKDETVQFKGNISVLKQIGLLQDARPTTKGLPITDKEGATSNKKIIDVLYNNSIHLKKQDFLLKKFNLPYEVQDNSVLEITLTAKKPPAPPKPKPKPEPSDKKKANLKAGTVDKFWVGDSNLYGDHLFTTLPSLKKAQKAQEDAKKKGDKKPASPEPKTPPPNNGHSLNLTLGFQEGERNLQAEFNPNETSSQKIKLTLKKGILNNIKINNPTDYDISINYARLTLPNKNKFIPKNLISKAQNAIVRYKGIDYERPNNTINKVVPGIILNIKGQSYKTVTVSMKRDLDSVLKTLKEFVIAYNNLMDYIKTTSHFDTDSLKFNSIQDREKNTTEKRELYEKMSEADKKTKDADGTLYKGFLRSDSTVRTVKTKIQSLIAQPFKTDDKSLVMFLSQLGIKRVTLKEVGSSENAQEDYSAGYLNFTKKDQEFFLSFLDKHYDSIKQLFFNHKSPSSLLFDIGLAIELNKTIEKMVSRNGGLIKSRTTAIDSQIKAQDKRMKRLEQQLKDVEDKLRRDFGKVYSAQQQAKSMSSQLDKLK